MSLNGFVSYNNASVYICIETGYIILTLRLVIWYSLWDWLYYTHFETGYMILTLRLVIWYSLWDWLYERSINGRM